jgi:hypothetical protein
MKNLHWSRGFPASHLGVNVYVDVENPWFPVRKMIHKSWIFHIYVSVQEGIKRCYPRISSHATPKKSHDKKHIHQIKSHCYPYLPLLSQKIISVLNMSYHNCLISIRRMTKCILHLYDFNIFKWRSFWSPIITLWEINTEKITNLN